MAGINGVLNLFLLKADGLARCRWDGKSDQVEELNNGLEGETVREVAADPFHPNKLYAATLTEIHVSEDGGASWQWLPSGGIDYRDIWTMAVHPTRANEIYVGTLPAAVFVSENGGRSFRELAAFRSLPDYHKWTFPPGAHVPHARCIALDARVPDEILVGIEEGGVARAVATAASPGKTLADRRARPHFRKSTTQPASFPMKWASMRTAASIATCIG
jgi:hypothetical protein